ncbi:MAG: hypothetical protein ABEI97_04135 [Candidatus Nanohaloarchaea archaeon]
MTFEERVAAVTDRLEQVVTDPDAAFDLVTTVTGVGIGLSISSVSFALTAVFLQRGSTTLVFPALALFWAGYLFAHYAATGKVIHQGGGGTTLPSDRSKAVMAVAGVLMLLVGITTFPLPAARGDIPLASLTVLVAGVGYVVAHYGFTGDPL